MKYPLAWVTCFFSLGIWAGRFLALPLFLPAALAIILLITCLLAFRSRLLFNLLLGSLIFALGFIAIQRSGYLAPGHILRFYNKGEAPCIIQGVIDSDSQLDNGRTKFLFKAKAIQRGTFNHKCSGQIMVSLRSKVNFSYGDELLLRGNLSLPFRRRQQERLLMLKVNSDLDILVLDRNKGFPLKRLALYLKHKMQEVIYKYNPKVSASILEAMLLGEKKNISPLIYNAMVKTGTVHILAWQYTKLSNCTFPNNITL